MAQHKQIQVPARVVARPTPRLRDGRTERRAAGGVTGLSGRQLPSSGPRRGPPWSAVVRRGPLGPVSRSPGGGQLPRQVRHRRAATAAAAAAAGYNIAPPTGRWDVSDTRWWPGLRAGQTRRSPGTRDVSQEVRGSI